MNNPIKKRWNLIKGWYWPKFFIYDMLIIVAIVAMCVAYFWGIR